MFPIISAKLLRGVALISSYTSGSNRKIRSAHFFSITAICFSLSSGIFRDVEQEQTLIRDVLDSPSRSPVPGLFATALHFTGEYHKIEKNPMLGDTVSLATIRGHGRLETSR